MVQEFPDYRVKRKENITFLFATGYLSMCDSIFLVALEPWKIVCLMYLKVENCMFYALEGRAKAIFVTKPSLLKVDLHKPFDNARQIQICSEQ